MLVWRRLLLKPFFLFWNSATVVIIFLHSPSQAPSRTTNWSLNLDLTSVPCLCVAACMKVFFRKIWISSLMNTSTMVCAIICCFLSCVFCVLCFELCCVWCGYLFVRSDIVMKLEFSILVILYSICVLCHCELKFQLFNTSNIFSFPFFNQATSLVRTVRLWLAMCRSRWGW